MKPLISQIAVDGQPTGKVPRYNQSLNKWEYGDQSNWGTEYNYAEDENEATFTNDIFVAKVTLNLTGLVGGNYHVAFSTEWMSAGSFPFIEVHLDDVLISLGEIVSFGRENGSANTGDSLGFVGHTILNISSGNHTLKIVYKNSGAGQTSLIGPSRLELWRSDAA